MLEVGSSRLAELHIKKVAFAVKEEAEVKGLDLLSEHVKGWVDLEVKAVDLKSSTAQANVELLNEIRAMKKLLLNNTCASLECSKTRCMPLFCDNYDNL